MGSVCRISMIFTERLWPEDMSFLFTPELLPSVWWTSCPADDHVLTGWVGGPRSSVLLSMSPLSLRQWAIIAVSDALGRTTDEIRSKLIGFHTHDWNPDASALGAYSWVPAGAMGASAQMCESIEDTLIFSGEHTDTTGHWGTVHGALRSGLRAANQVLNWE